MAILNDYTTAFPWLERLLTTSDSNLPSLSDAFPNLADSDLEAQALAVQKWRSQSPLHGRKLVCTKSLSLSGDVIRQINDTLSAQTLRASPAVVLDRVAPALLLPPLVEPGLSAAVAAESVRLGEVVAFISGSGDQLPPFGTIGVVIAVHDGFVEVLCAKPFVGGTNLEGRISSKRAAQAPLASLINLSQPSSALSWASGFAGTEATRSKPMLVRDSPVPAAVVVAGPTGAGFQAPSLGRGRGSLLPTKPQSRSPNSPSQALANMSGRGMPPARRSLGSAPHASTNATEAPLALPSFAPFSSENAKAQGSALLSANTGAGATAADQAWAGGSKRSGERDGWKGLVGLVDVMVAASGPELLTVAMQSTEDVRPHLHPPCFPCGSLMLCGRW
jgi:hypothetical protein